jgi:hypothetical protein
VVGERPSGDREQPRQGIGWDRMGAPPRDHERLRDHVVDGRRRRTPEHVRPDLRVMGVEQRLERPRPMFVCGH